MILGCNIMQFQHQVIRGISHQHNLKLFLIKITMQKHPKILDKLSTQVDINPNYILHWEIQLSQLVTKLMLLLLKQLKLAIEKRSILTRQPLKNFLTETFVKYQIVGNQRMQDANKAIFVLVAGVLQDAASFFAQSILLSDIKIIQTTTKEVTK